MRARVPLIMVIHNRHALFAPHSSRVDADHGFLGDITDHLVVLLEWKEFSFTFDREL